MTGSKDGEMTFEEERERDELEQALALIREAEEKYPRTETFEDQTLRLAIELSLEDEALKKAETEGGPDAPFDGHTGEDDEFTEAVSLQRRTMREQASAVARRRPTQDGGTISVTRRPFLAPVDQRTSFSAIRLEDDDSVVDINSLDGERCDLEVSTRNLSARHVVTSQHDKDDDESIVDVDTVGGETCDLEVRTQNMKVRRRSMTNPSLNQEPPPELLERLQRLDVSVSSRRSSTSARAGTREELTGTSEVKPSRRSTSRGRSVGRSVNEENQEIEEVSSLTRLRELGQARREQRAAKQAELSTSLHTHIDEGGGQQSRRKTSSRHSRRHSASRARSRRSSTNVSGESSAITAPTVMFGASSEADKKLSEKEMEEIVRALMEAGASPAELARVFHSRST
jgi:hypothetical protein